MPGSAANSAGSAPSRDQVQGEVADDLGRRGDLHDVAEDVVRRGVHVLDLLELLTEAERDRLLAQVGQLPAGDLVAVDPTGGRRQAGLEGRVDRGGSPPSRAPGRTTAASDSPVSRAECSVAATRADSGGCDVVPAIAAQAASTASTPASIAASRVRELTARSVVGVQVHRQVEPLAQRGHQTSAPRVRAAGRPCP